MPTIRDILDNPNLTRLGQSLRDRIGGHTGPVMEFPRRTKESKLDVFNRKHIAEMEARAAKFPTKEDEFEARRRLGLPMVDISYGRGATPTQMRNTGPIHRMSREVMRERLQGKLNK